MLPVAALAATVLVAAVSPAVAGPRYERVSHFTDVEVGRAEGLEYRLRTSFVFRSAWRLRDGRATRRFGAFGSCHMRGRLTVSAVTGPAEEAPARVARELPDDGARIYDSGTRRRGAWRVGRRTGEDAVSAIFAVPAPNVEEQHPDGIVWLELRVRARPTHACHSVPYRGVSDELGTTFGSARVGGFSLR